MISLSKSNPTNTKKRNYRKFEQLNPATKFLVVLMFILDFALFVGAMIFMALDNDSFGCFSARDRLNSEWMAIINTKPEDIEKLIADINIWNPDKPMGDDVANKLRDSINDAIIAMKKIFPEGFNHTSYNDYFRNNQWYIGSDEVYKKFNDITNILNNYKLEGGNDWLIQFIGFVQDMEITHVLFRPMVVDMMTNIVATLMLAPILFVSIISYMKDPETFALEVKRNGSVDIKSKELKPLSSKILKFNRHGYWIINFGIAWLSFALLLGSHFTIIYCYPPLIIGNICITIPALIYIILAIFYFFGFFFYINWVCRHDINSNESNPIQPDLNQVLVSSETPVQENTIENSGDTPQTWEQ